MPAIDRTKTEQQRLAEIHRSNDRTAAYRLRDLASSFKYLSPGAQDVIAVALARADSMDDVEKVLRAAAERIENVEQG